MDGAVRTSQGAGEARGRTTPPPSVGLVFLFLERLDRLVAIQDLPGLTAQQRRLVDRALCSTYWDCLELGLRTDARQILGLPPN